MELYSFQSIMETEVRRKILAWYSRFDVMGGLMAGHSAVLGREWFLATETYYREQSLSYPMSIDYKIEATIASHRRLACDLALLYTQFSQGDINIEHFTNECDKYSQYLDSWRENLDPVFSEETYLVKSFGEGLKQDPEDIVNPYEPGGLYEGALFTFNFMLMDWHAMTLMHKHKTALSLNRRPPPEVQSLALEICRHFETIEYWPESPPGAVVKAQGSLGLAIVFLPRDEKHIMWCRRKLAKVESLGCVTNVLVFPSKNSRIFTNIVPDIFTLPRSVIRWQMNGEYLRSMNPGFLTRGRVRRLFEASKPLWKTVSRRQKGNRGTRISGTSKAFSRN